MTVPLRAATARCGAKAWHLGRLLRAGFPVPDGVVVTAPAATAEIERAVRELDGPFAVRSSALGEDGATASFAGQLNTTLNVPADGVVAAVRHSARPDGAGEYAARIGQAPVTEVPVLVQVMVPAETAGVLFTRHPVTGADEVVIEAAAGLGDQVVNGTVTPRPFEHRELIDTGRRIEALFGGPQDIEWAIAGDRLWILQARPITTRPGTAAKPVGEVLVTGTAASPGTATGPVRIITSRTDFPRFNAGDVLVCRTTSPAWTPLLARAAAVVTETGGILAHAAIVAREFAIPAVVATPHATTALTDGQTVVVDGGNGRVTKP